ncbi:hypothetical protein G7046_g8213 [Stylonectria norvegica]|nr:hypothetical protein G7046_g8213 [Stylonectria norvegica]
MSRRRCERLVDADNKSVGGRNCDLRLQQRGSDKAAGKDRIRNQEAESIRADQQNEIGAPGFIVVTDRTWFSGLLASGWRAPDVLRNEGETKQGGRQKIGQGARQGNEQDCRGGRRREVLLSPGLLEAVDGGGGGGVGAWEVGSEALFAQTGQQLTAAAARGCQDAGERARDDRHGAMASRCADHKAAISRDGWWLGGRIFWSCESGQCNYGIEPAERK